MDSLGNPDKKGKVKCQQCDSESSEDLSQWPPTLNKKENLLFVPYICVNGHKFILKIQLL